MLTDLEKLKDLLGSDESEKIEFKTSFHSAKFGQHLQNQHKPVHDWLI